jgi:hypothetical protein
LASAENADILRLLVPELSETDISQQSEKLVGVIGENQINTVFRRKFLRPIEKQVAEQIGVEDIRVDYNLGNAVLKGVSGFSPFSSLGNQQNLLGLSVSKLLSQNLYLDVRTQLDLRSDRQGATDANDLSAVELRYYLVRNLSVNLSNFHNEGEAVRRNKLSLRYSYEY